MIWKELILNDVYKLVTAKKINDRDMQ